MINKMKKKKPDLKKPADTHDKRAVTGSGAINKPASDPEPDKSVAGSNQVEPGSGNRSVSIKELINDLTLEEPDNNNQEEKKIDTEVTPVTAREVRKISPKEFMPAWKKLCESLKDEGPRISGMFKSIQPEIHSDNLVTLQLNNAAQLDLFSRHYKHKVLSYFETLFGKGSFSLELTVDSAEPDGIIYSDEQKYQFLVSRYPNMKDIRKAFNLDYE